MHDEGEGQVRPHLPLLPAAPWREDRHLDPQSVAWGDPDEQRVIEGDPKLSI
jgi:hypothetical protein